MAKTKEELNELKNQLQTVTKNLDDLTDEELDEITGGLCDPATWVKLGEKFKEILEQRDKSKNKDQ